MASCWYQGVDSITFALGVSLMSESYRILMRKSPNRMLTLTSEFHWNLACRALGARTYRASGVTAEAPFVGDWRPLRDGELVLLGSDGVFECMDATLVRVTNEGETSDSSSPVRVPCSDFG